MVVCADQQFLLIQGSSLIINRFTGRQDTMYDCNNPIFRVQLTFTSEMVKKCKDFNPAGNVNNEV